MAANADPANAPTIISSTGLSVKASPAPHPKADLAAKDGITSGSVKLVARAAPGHRASYDWQWSQDQKTWTMVPSTLQAHTIAYGLPVAATVCRKNQNRVRHVYGSTIDHRPSTIDHRPRPSSIRSRREAVLQSRGGTPRNAASRWDRGSRSPR